MSEPATAEAALSGGEIIPPELLTAEAVNLLERRQMEQFAFEQNLQKEGWYRRAHAHWAANVGRWPAGQEKPKPQVPRRVVCVGGSPPAAGWPQLPTWMLQVTDDAVCDELPDPTVVPTGRVEAVGVRIQFTDTYQCMIQDTMPMGHETTKDGFRLAKRPPGIAFMAPQNVLGEPGGTYYIIGKAA